MAIVLKSVKPEYVVVEPGEYTALLDDVKQTTGKFGPLLRFQFRIAEGEPYENIPVSLVCSAFLTPGNRLDKILQTLGTASTNVGEEINVESLKGAVVKVYVENAKGEGETTYNNVTKLRKLREGEAKGHTVQAVTSPAATTGQAPATAPVTTASATTPPVSEQLKKEDVPF